MPSPSKLAWNRQRGHQLAAITFRPQLGRKLVGNVPRENDGAIRLINSSSYGNMASIFTSSGKLAREFRQRVEAGMIGVNVGLPAPMAYFPFTGWKRSFFGDLHATGLDAFRFYTRHKVVTSRWL